MYRATFRPPADNSGKPVRIVIQASDKGQAYEEAARLLSSGWRLTSLRRVQFMEPQGPLFQGDRR